MKIPFLDRGPELRRLRRAFDARAGSLVVVYGRRRLGKSRLLLEAIRDRPAAYYVGDDRHAAVQREDLARQIATSVEGFERVAYPDWSALLERWWREAPPRAILVLDEFPRIVQRSPELPSLLQKLVDGDDHPPRHVALCGSSQRMMHGLVLEGSAPLYGRASEILKIGPLAVGWTRRALRTTSSAAAIDHWAAWGGVPRYWELAADHASRPEALRALALDPLGVLHREPERLLRDDMAKVTRASSILALVGRGAHRISEVGGRLGMPATSLSRPMAQLVDLGLLEREIPWGRSVQDSKRSLYRVADPFLRTWFRFVDPERSRLAAGQLDEVSRAVEERWPQHLAEAWEDLARASVARLRLFGQRWRPAARWWGPGVDRKPLELDIVAEAVEDPELVLCGDARVSASSRDAARALQELRGKAQRCPDLRGRRVACATWILRRRGAVQLEGVVSAAEVLESSVANTGQERRLS